MKKFTFEIFVGTPCANSRVGWRKTLRAAFKFAKTLSNLRATDWVTIRRRERRPEDFSR